MKSSAAIHIEDKPINHRPLVFIAAAFISGILLGGALLGESLTFFISVTIVSLTIILIMFFKKRGLLLVLAALLIGLIAFFISYSLTEVEEGTRYTVASGRISEQYKAKEGYNYSYLLTDITMGGAVSSRNAVLYSDDPLEIGNLVTVYGEAEAFNYKLFSGYSMSYYSDNINYRIKSNSVSVDNTGRQTFFEKAYLKIKRIYLEKMGSAEGGVALSLVFGDRSYLDSEVDSDIKASGLTHIFSVSGLHVAFLASAVFFGLRLLKINKKASLVIVSALIFVYGIMTGFPSSMIRAGIMLLIMLCAEMFFKRFDPLSALAFAAVIILILRPLYIFELGFQMSVTSMLGIFCFYRTIKRFINIGKGKISNFISSSLAMSLSANSLLLAITINTFGYFGMYFFLGNIIVIPFIGITYSLLMFLTLFSLLIPPAAVFMIVPRFLITAIIEISAFIANLPLASVRLGQMGIFAVIYILTLLFMSKFVMVERQRKLTALIAIIGFSVVLMMVL